MKSKKWIAVLIVFLSSYLEVMGQEMPNHQQIYQFVNEQLGFLGHPPDGIVPYFQKEAIVNVLRGGENIDAIFFDRIQQMNTNLIDSLLTAEEVRWMKSNAELQTLEVWEADSLAIGNIELIDKAQMMRNLYREKLRVGFAISPPYLSPKQDYAFLMIQRRAATDGWDCLMLWQKRGSEWKVIDSKIWLWHQVEVVMKK